LGAQVFSTRDAGVAPLVIKGPLKGGRTKLPGINSQWLSSLLIAGALSQDGITVIEDNLMERPYVDMTMGWMKLAGATCCHKNYDEFNVPGGEYYKSFTAQVPGDWGSSCYPMIGAAITDSKVTFVGMDPNDFAGERKFPYLLKEMGTKVTLSDSGRTITVEGGSDLHGIEIDCSGTPDAVPILAVLGCKAQGKTILYNIGASRLKETDRISSIREELTKMGGKFEETSDSLTIYHSELKGAEIDGRHDHRIIMATAIAGLIAKGPTLIDHAEYVKVSFPSFYEAMKGLGAHIELIDRIRERG
jgi:3-phosphoshikimate 1-carboxyvinyltransferase